MSWSDEAVTAAYFRTQGDEVDLVLETWDGRVVGFEVKAGSRVQDADLSGLRLLRDRLGERFVAGFLLNLGELAYRAVVTRTSRQHPLVLWCSGALAEGNSDDYHICHDDDADHRVLAAGR